MDLDQLENIDFDKLTVDKRVEVQQLINQINKRKIEYPILDFKLQPHQQEFANAI